MAEKEKEIDMQKLVDQFVTSGRKMGDALMQMQQAVATDQGSFEYDQAQKALNKMVDKFNELGDLCKKFFEIVDTLPETER